MCGRYTLRRVDRLRDLFDAALAPTFEEFTERPRFNIAPSQHVPVIRRDKSDERVLSAVRWGLIPYFTKDRPKQQPINARAETVATSGMFRGAFQRRRCLMPADGFFEWHGSKPPKQPYFFFRPDEEPFAFAGIWERWTPPDAEPVDTCCLITTTPNGVMCPIHNRMPVILQPDRFDTWLDRTTPLDDAIALLKPLDDSLLLARPVSTAVNNARNEGPELIEPIAPDPQVDD